jgi:hypothetical protein
MQLDGQRREHTMHFVSECHFGLSRRYGGGFRRSAERSSKTLLDGTYRLAISHASAIVMATEYGPPHGNGTHRVGGLPQRR